MKKLIACLLVCLLVMSFSAPVLASALPPPAHMVAHHGAKSPSFWMKYGRFTLGLAVALCIVAELSHDKTEKAKQTP
ncbi:MAG: hypothetical protein P4N41_12170 [Negativicutes bacterium]|nr:hypothetical protein [Negativicutes bacterium]